MERTLQVLFRRDSTRDRLANNVHLEGFQLLWPDYRPVHSGFDAFCRHSLRILSLHQYLAQREECLLELIQFPCHGRDDAPTRLPGLRVRRLMLKRQGLVGRIHLLNGDPTEVTFQIGRDEQRLLAWIGLMELSDEGKLWFDFTSRPLPSGTFQAHRPLWNEPGLSPR